MEKPKLRQDIQLFPFSDQGQQGFILQDSIYGKHTLFLSDGALFIAQFFDGTNSLDNIQQLLKEKAGGSLPREQLQQIVDVLDSHFFLENENFLAMQQREVREYLAVPDRPPLMAGSSYPEDPQPLKTLLDEVLQAGDTPQPEGLPAKALGLVVPHIDLERGKATYAAAWNALKQGAPPRRCIILGINHRFPADNPLIATDRRYTTPLGGLETDSDLLQGLQSGVDWDLLDDQYAHRGEHSVELPVLFLQHLFPNQQPTILPLLANFSVKDDPRVEACIGALKTMVQEQGDGLLLIASVDFSHIGPQFGWNKPVTPADMEELGRLDRTTLNCLEAGDGDAFWADIMEDNNRRNIDALSACYLLTKVLERPGLLLDYRAAFSPRNTVSFASMVYGGG